MKRKQIYLLFLFLSMIGFIACQEDRLSTSSADLLNVEEGIPGTLALHINATPSEIHIITRSTTDATAEEKNISTLYVFIIQVKDENHPAANPILTKKWFPDAGSLQDASGKLKVTLSAVSCRQVRIFAVANIHAPNQLTNDEELLEYYNNVTNEEQLYAARALLRSDNRTALFLTDRSQGNLPASGYFQGIYQNTGTEAAPEYPLQVLQEKYALTAQNGRLLLQQATNGHYNGHNWNAGENVNGRIWLQHLDAKINFEIQPDAGLPQGSYFKLKSWQVVNLHTQAYISTHPGQNVCENSGNTGLLCVSNSGEMSGSYITETQITDNNDRVKSQFSFYALENNHTSPAPFTTPAEVVNTMNAENYSLTDFTKADKAYVLREKKDSDGNFKYAPAKATYVILKGEFYTPSTHANGSEGMRRAAKVKYLIHLGYVGDRNTDGQAPATNNPELNKLNDYSILRNSVYTYKITVKDVENIRVEAEINGRENQPSAEGSVIDSEFDLQADSHYEQRLIMFDIRVLAQKIDQASAKFAYTVKTPFTRGEVTVEVQENDADDRPQNLDDQWVEFAYLGEGMNGRMSSVMIQRMQEGGGYGLPYAYTYTSLPSESKIASDPVQLWKPTALLRNLTIWKKKYDTLAGKRVEDPDSNPYILQDDGTKFYLQRLFTVYVDEYYYTQNPNTGTTSNMLWPQFCNTGDRTMRIFLTNSISSDGNSSYSRSGLNIRQKSIQTSYALSATEQQLANVAFGMEHTDEYGRNYNVSGSSNTPFHRYSTEKNGLENNLLGLYQNTGLTEQAIGSGYSWKELYKIFPQDARTSEGQTPVLLTDAKRQKRLVNVAALSRNRDNNRNGIIDKEEVRWYIPAQRQMQNLYLGSFFAEDPLFQEKLSVNHTVYYVTSSCFPSAGGLRFQIASQGPIFRSFRTIGNNALNNSYIRCVRNLGTPPTLSDRYPYTGGTSVPEKIVQITQAPENGNYIITYSKYSNQGIRYYIANGPLGSHNQNQAPARVYKSFIIAKKNIYGQNADGSLNTGSPGAGVNWENAQKLCAAYSEEPDHSDKGSWRLPNVSEALGMLTHMPREAINVVHSQILWSCTQCSGTHATPEYFSISFSTKQILITPATTQGYLRCIRDYQ